jgi:hypothetical protein
MRQQFRDPARWLRRQPRQNILEVGIRIVPVELGRLDQIHDGRTASARAQADGRQCRLPVHRILHAPQSLDRLSTSQFALGDCAQWGNCLPDEAGDPKGEHPLHGLLIVYEQLFAVCCGDSGVPLNQVAIFTGGRSEI